MKSVCNIRPHKKETHRTRLTAGVNRIDYLGEISTPTSDLNTMKLHVNNAISDFKSIHMCMDVIYFISSNHIGRAEYNMMKISMIP